MPPQSLHVRHREVIGPGLGVPPSPLGPEADLVGVISRGPVTTLSAISRPPIDALPDRRRDIGAGLLSRVLRLGPRRLFARPGCLVVDGGTRRTQPGQQYGSYRGRIETNILGVWWMCLAALQSERQVQLL